jgi:hypothetical protein
MFHLLIVRIAIGCLIAWSIAVVLGLFIAWRRKGLFLALRRIALFHLVLLVLGVLFLWDLRPSVTTQLMSTTDKIAFKQEIAHDGDDEHYRASFSGDEMARGLRSAADLARIELNSQVEFPADDHFQFQFTVGLPMGYVNGQIHGTASIREGSLSTEWDRLRIGRVPMPGFVCRFASWSFIQWMTAESITRQALMPVVLAEIRDGRAHMEVLRRQNLSGGIASHFQSPELKEETALAIEVVRAWIENAKSNPPNPKHNDSFVQSMQFLLRETKRREPSWTPVRQNRVTIIAGGVALGHAKLARLTGHPLNGEESENLARLSSRVQVHGRNDLVRHFWVSAAITRLASARVSHIAGVTKEEMDSGAGGSGFSFADLLADRAGVRFAESATGSAESAERLQKKIAEDFVSTDLIPSIEGLPEGLSQSRFEQEFGGTSGQAYRKWSEDIDHRLRSASLLTP